MAAETFDKRGRVLVKRETPPPRAKACRHDREDYIMGEKGWLGCEREEDSHDSTRVEVNRGFVQIAQACVPTVKPSAKIPGEVDDT